MWSIFCLVLFLKVCQEALWRWAVSMSKNEKLNRKPSTCRSSPAGDGRSGRGRVCCRAESRTLGVDVYTSRPTGLLRYTSFYAPSWLPLFPPTSEGVLDEKSSYGYRHSTLAARETKWPLSTSIVFVSMSQWAFDERNISEEEKKSSEYLMAHRANLNPLTKQSNVSAFPFLSNLFPKMWYIQFGCSGNLQLF